MSAEIVHRACVAIDRRDTPLGMSLGDRHPHAAAVLRDALEALHGAVLAGTRVSPRTSS
jgi:hypothetical protein